MTSRYIHFAFWATALIYTFFSGSLSGMAGIILKVAPILLLLLLIIRELQGPLRLTMTFAILFSGIGDAVLAVEADLFVLGLASFLVAQLIYASIFWTRLSPTPQRRWLVVAFLPVVAGAGSFILPASGDLLIPVAAYLLAIATMVIGAALTDRPWQWLFMGAFIFALSDSLIAINKFVYPIPYEGFWIMGSYYLAQYLIVNGVVLGEKSNKTNPL